MYGDRAAIAGVGAAAWILVAAPAQASNGNTPRTPPVFFEQACMRVVDRSVDPVFHVDYSIPFEDTELQPDEPADARRLQFFGICHDVRIDEVIPSWLDQADIDTALAAGVLDEPPDASDVLAGHAGWDVGHDGMAGTCVLPITTVAERVPITCDGIDGGADWDTTDVPAGNYLVYGYTWAPVTSLWTRRLGVVRVHDGDTAAIGPAVALTSPSSDTTIYEADGFPIVGCVDGGPGTTVTIEWTKIANIDDDSSWSLLCGDVQTDDGTFAVTFHPPPEAVNQAIVFRATATDDQGRSWLAHAPGRALVFPGDGDGVGPEVEPGPDFCALYPDATPVGEYVGDNACGAGPSPGDETGSDSGSAADTGGTTGSGTGNAGGGSSSGPDAGDDGRGSGCGCTSTGGRNGSPIAVLLVLLAALRRRRPSTGVALSRAIAR